MLRLNIPITKVDAARRLVYGVATAEVADRAGEICDYASTKPLYEKWSDAIATSSGGKSLGNLRAMHGTIAAGKVTALTFNDAAKQIEICAKVVDDAEWSKVEEGVYTGFSQGGAYARRWTDPAGAKRYTAEPHEISLVDLPCLAEARFEMIKADGSHEWRTFRDLSPPTPPPPAPPVPVEKAGARNSARDLARIQAVHDSSVELGANCGIAKGLHDHGAELLKQFDRLDAMLTKTLVNLGQRLATVEAQPMPLPFAVQTRAVAKNEDGVDADVDALLDNPDALSLLAIKLAQRQRR